MNGSDELAGKYTVWVGWEALAPTSSSSFILKTFFSFTLSYGKTFASYQALHIFLSIAHSGYSPSNFMSFFMHSQWLIMSSIIPIIPIIPTLTLKTDVQTISICHVLPHQPHTEFPEGWTNPHCGYTRSSNSTGFRIIPDNRFNRILDITGITG